MKSTVLVKAFRLLEAFCEERSARSLADLAAASQTSKPTAHRILNDLVAMGYVERRHNGVYQLTGKLSRLSVPPDERRLVSAAEPILSSLHAECGETVNLAVLRRGRVVYLRVLECDHPLRRVTLPQESDPFHSTALGRMMVAGLDDRQRDDYLTRQPLEACTPKTVTDPRQLDRILRRIRRQGYALEKDQSELGAMCIAAPVVREGTPAAISVSAPLARVDARSEAMLIEGVSAAAAELTGILVEIEHPMKVDDDAAV